MVVSFNKEELSAMLQEMVVRIKTEEDILELKEIGRIFRKNVPLTMRSYMAAYLLKQLSLNGGGRQNGGRNNGRRQDSSRYDSSRQDGREQSRQKKEREPRGGRAGESAGTGSSSAGNMGAEKTREKKPQVRIPLDEALSTTLFLSVGRNRRVFPRDLVALISHAANIDRERIGDIRVLDNYSFVQLLSEDTDGIIAALDGSDYRGRKLSVSYSRKKEEDDDIPGSVEQPETDVSAFPEEEPETQENS